MKTGIAHMSLAALTTMRLRERILYGDTARGQRLVEAELSHELGVSRIPVREALRQLASEGIVTIEPRRGAIVPTYTDAQKRELTEVRATLESLIARLVARRRDLGPIAELEEIVEEADRRMTAGQGPVPLSQNLHFHDVLSRASGNSLLREMSVALHQRMILVFGPQCVIHAAQIWHEHKAILDAVMEGDEDLAALLAARHVYTARQFH